MIRIIPNKEKIINARIRMGLTGKKLAERIGTSRQTILNLESGSSVSPVTSKAVCDILEKPFDELFTIEEGE